MKATDILIEEHHVILKALDCMEKILEEAENTGTLNAVAVSEWIDFIKHFADHCHHGKEEKKFFPMMEESGVPREGGPIGCMLSEHEFGRNCVRQMKEVFESA
ncbi:MAG: hemerythrin domain-containing protein, partial [Planctomycetota bacterium]